MKVYMSPYGKSYQNPFNIQLSTALSNRGVDVKEFNIIKNHRDNFVYNEEKIGNADFLHLHWPDKQVFLDDNRKGYQENPPKNKDVLRSMDNFFSLITYCKNNGVKIIWTVHDLFPIEKEYSELEHFFWNQFSDKVDGLAGIGSKGPERAKKVFSSLEGVPYCSMPHGGYKGCYPRPQGNLSGLDKNKITFLCFGQIREKKGLIKLVEVFPEEYQLIIAGNPVFRQICKRDTEFITRLKMLSNRKENVFIYPSYVSRMDVPIFLNSCDYGVLPYERCLYSGSLFLMLSYGVPVLTSNSGVFSDLSEKYGSWVYSEDINKNSFERADNYLSESNPISFRTWDSIAEEVENFYKEIL